MEDVRKLFTCKECQKRFICFNVNRTLAGMGHMAIVPEEVRYFMQRAACSDLVVIEGLTSQKNVV
jgi:hypothetical protein